MKKKIKKFTFQPTFLTFNNELGQILKFLKIIIYYSQLVIKVSCNKILFFILLQPFHIISLPVDIFLDSKLCQSYLYVNSLVPSYDLRNCKNSEAIMASIRNQNLINQSKYLALSDGIYTILAPFP